MTRTLLYVGAGVAGLVVAIVLARSASRAAGAVSSTVSGAVNAINPANPDNIVARGVNGVVQTVTDSPNSLGTWLAETFDATTRAADKWARETFGGSSSSAPVLSALDRDDADMGAAMRALSSAPYIDLGLYADTIARDDADMGRFSVGVPFMQAIDISRWSQNLRGSRVPTNSEFQ